MKSAILAEAQREVIKHTWDYFVSGDGRSIADGGVVMAMPAS
jgi:hypothetical protein